MQSQQKGKSSITLLLLYFFPSPLLLIALQLYGPHHNEYHTCYTYNTLALLAVKMTSRSTMYYVETSAQRSHRLNINPNPIAQFLRRTYWAYYVHLPFYGLTQLDSFWLHTFFLTLMSLGLFGVVKYCILF